MIMIIIIIIIIIIITIIIIMIIIIIISSSRQLSFDICYFLLWWIWNRCFLLRVTAKQKVSALDLGYGHKTVIIHDPLLLSQTTNSKSLSCLLTHFGVI